MKTVLKLALLGILMTLALACSKSKSGQHATKGEHAKSTVVVGSHDDWCGEHGVPESQCTRCNPDLIAAFKATGDWCAEHGVPESQCTRCNPDLKIVRPPATGAPTEAH